MKGTWSENEKGLHINTLEMFAVAKACQALAPSLRNHTVLCLIKNSTTVAYIRKQRGTRSRELLTATHHLFQVMSRHNIWILPHHIPGQLNALADMASRARQVIASEWMLASSTFLRIAHQSRLGRPTVDLFATRMTTQLPNYMSPCPDPQAVAIDALSSQWTQSTLYAFSPLSLMTKMTERMAREKTFQMLLVAPATRSLPWFPLLSKWSILHQCHWN